VGICFQVAKAQYLEQLAHQVRNVKFVGIAVSDSDIEQSEILAQIFVMPDVREERSKSSKQSEVSWFWSSSQTFVETFNGQQNSRQEEPTVWKPLEQNTLLNEQKEWATRDRSAPRIPAQKVINLAQKKAVILGAPGSGKTMLASYFALMLCETAQSDPTQIGLEKDADYLPVVVRIRDWILQPKMGLLEYLRSNAEANLACKEVPTGFFEHWLDRGKALMLKGKKAQKAIQAVLDVGSEYEQWLHRDLLFAGWCLTEDPPELSVVAADWVGEILDRLVDLEVDDSDRIFSTISDEATKILRCFGETTIERTVWAKLQVKRDQIDRFQLLEFQAELGQEKEAINALLSLLGDEESNVRYDAAIELGQLGNESLEVVSRLISLLNDSESYVRYGAISALGNLGKSSELIRLEVMRWLEQNPKNDGIGDAIDCLWSIVVE
jgi:hypothetical protein